jgi:hypothetical protein
MVQRRARLVRAASSLHASNACLLAVSGSAAWAMRSHASGAWLAIMRSRAVQRSVPTTPAASLSRTRQLVGSIRATGNNSNAHANTHAANPPIAARHTRPRCSSRVLIAPAVQSIK